MKLPITQIEVLRVAIPMVGEGFRNAYTNNTAQHSIIVRIRSNDTLGLGNVDPLPGYSNETIEQSLDALHNILTTSLLGQDAGNVRQIIALMDNILPGYLEAKSAIEMACCDLLSRFLSIPLHQFLGGAVIRQLRFNGWIGIVPPEQAAREALQWQAAGFLSTKVKLGGDIQADLERIRAIRQAVGPNMQIRGDANASYSVSDSIELGHHLEPYQLQLLEQPVAANDLAGLAMVRQAISTPIMADEAITDHQSLINVIRADCADIVKLKIMKQGGLIKCLNMMETASAAGLKIVIGHGFGLNINTMAECMLAATNSNVLEGLESVGPLKMNTDVTSFSLDFSNGFMELPDTPGLGLELDEKKLKQLRIDN